MSDSDGEETRRPAGAGDLPAVEARIRELQHRKRRTIRWHMSRDTAERAIAAIKEGQHYLVSGKGKSRRRKRHKRLL
ncbi:MAG: hypothetical protein ABR499_00010 [Gemmatimonadaceae bacterium]